MTDESRPKRGVVPEPDGAASASVGGAAIAEALHDAATVPVDDDPQRAVGERAHATTQRPGVSPAPPDETPAEPKQAFLDADAETLASEAQVGQAKSRTVVINHHPHHFDATEAEPLSVQDKLGEGGMGEVWGAQALRLERDVAVKILGTAFSDDASARARFHREALITAQLAHPNVIPVYALQHTEEGLPAFTMKWVRGQTLFEFVRDCRRELEAGRLGEGKDLPARLELFLKICDAMAYSHDEGVIHRDLKPSNIMIGDFNELYVMDWGMARALDGAKDASVGVHVRSEGADATQLGSVLGTPMYMAPEQALGLQEEVGPAADQFALGLILYVLCSLKTPRSAATVDRMIHMARQGVKPQMRSDGFPPELKAVISRATEALPQDRYPSVQALAAEIRRHLRGAKVQAHDESPLQRARRVIRRHPTVALSSLFAAVLVGLGAAAVGLYQAAEGERAARVRQAHLLHQIARVSREAQGVDRTLLRLSSLQTAVVEAVQQRLREAQAYPVTAWPQRRFGDKRGGQLLPLPGGPTETNFLHSSWQLAPKGDASRARQERGWVGGLERRFRDAMLHAIDPSAVTAGVSDEEAVKRLIPIDSIKYIYIGLKSGQIINFPGTVLPRQYDARLRPWYRGALRRPDNTWGAIYPDATGTGYLLPCTSVLRDEQGRILGVLGLDISADRFLKVLKSLQKDQTEVSWLVDKRGRVVLTSDETGLKTAMSLAGNNARRGRPVGIPALFEAARDGQKTGAVQWRGALYTYAPIPSMGVLLVTKTQANELPP